MTNRTSIKDSWRNKLDTILIVDDDPDWTDLLRTYFIDKYHVKVANSALEAIEMTREDRPVLLIIDLIMPVMDGFGLLRRLEDTTQFRIPTILLTGWKSAEVVECANAFGFVTVMGKPVSLMALDAMISAEINKKPEARSQKSEGGRG